MYNFSIAAIDRETGLANMEASKVRRPSTLTSSTKQSDTVSLFMPEAEAVKHAKDLPSSPEADSSDESSDSEIEFECVGLDLEGDIQSRGPVSAPAAALDFGDAVYLASANSPRSPARRLVLDATSIGRTKDDTCTLPRKPSNPHRAVGEQRRHFSTPSQRAPISPLVPSVRGTIENAFPKPPVSPRSPLHDLRREAAFRSFRTKQEAPRFLVSSEPELKEEEEEEEEEEEQEKKEQKPEKTAEIKIEAEADSDRAAARRGLFGALGENKLRAATPGLSSRPSFSHKRLPSLDQISARVSSMGAGTGIGSPKAQTPGLASPRTHMRSFSCPTPRTPLSQMFGEVEVIVTPPTPRPPQSQNTFIPGVVIRSPRSASSSSPSSPSTPFTPMSTTSESADGHLAPPPFEMAPGRAKMMAEYAAARARAMDMMRQAEWILPNSPVPPKAGQALAAAGRSSSSSSSAVPARPQLPSKHQQRADGHRRQFSLTASLEAATWAPNVNGNSSSAPRSPTSPAPSGSSSPKYVASGRRGYGQAPSSPSNPPSPSPRSPGPTSASTSASGPWRARSPSSLGEMQHQMQMQMQSPRSPSGPRSVSGSISTTATNPHPCASQDTANTSARAAAGKSMLQRIGKRVPSSPLA